MKRSTTRSACSTTDRWTIMDHKRQSCPLPAYPNRAFGAELA